MANFCNKCGTKVDPSSNVCTNCGNPIGGGSIPQPAPSQQPHQQSYQKPYQNVYGGGTSTRSPSALVLGIIGLVSSIILFAPIGIVIGLAALIIGVVYFPRDEQKAYAIIGLCLGALAMIIGFAFLWRWLF